MASFSLPVTTTKAFSTSNIPSNLYSWSFSPSPPSKIFLNGNEKHYRGFKVSCKAIDGDESEVTLVGKGKSERNVRSGLDLAANPAMPDIFSCHPICLKKPDCTVKCNCCPPKITDPIIDFKFPPPPNENRVRPSAHMVDAAYVAKFSTAIQLMKSLPEDDPRNFMQQAKVHCAYCMGAYDQVGHRGPRYQVHGSWLFFPFHRWYLYFFEKILGKLIDDPTFALPFWNWDTPAGMKIPPMFNDNSSPLYDQYRNSRHLPPTFIDFDYNGCDTDKTDIQKKIHNLTMMYRRMAPKTDYLFLGKPYLAGSKPMPGGGTIEHIPHNTVHDWTGDPTQPLHEDMGIFYSAGRDPIFYSHHGNVDRLWTIWKTRGGREFTDPNWLDAQFYFYDENKQVVRVTVRDCLNNQRLGYVYQDVPTPWDNYKPEPRMPRFIVANRYAGTQAPPDVHYPVALDKAVKVLLTRPTEFRGTEEKVLNIDGIEYSEAKYVKFDVYINDDDEKGNAEPNNTEFAGSFVSLPHNRNPGNKGKTSLTLGITELLKDLGAKRNDPVLVTLVPRSGCDCVTVDDINIKIIT